MKLYRRASRTGSPVDTQDLARLEAERIADDEVGEPFHPRVGHRTRKTRLTSCVVRRVFMVAWIRIAKT